MTSSVVTEIHVSAPGKLILHGEHAVVYGKAAIAAALNLRSHLQLKQTTDGNLQLELPDVGISVQFALASLESISFSGSLEDQSHSDEDILVIKNFAGIDVNSCEPKHLAIVSFLYVFCSIFKNKSQWPSLRVHFKSDLPVGAGLGSSAAFSVSLSAALLQLAGHIDSLKLADGITSWSNEDKIVINKWGFICEKIIHGRPSGIDNSISTYGGALKMQNGQITHLEKMPQLSVMLVNTKVPRSTMVLVAGVRQKYNLYQDVMEPILNSVEAITKRAENIYQECSTNITDDGFKALGDLVDLNHNLLNAMGVGHASLDQVVAVTKKYGLHSKLTGAGGGGCAYVLIPSDTSEELLSSLKEELNALGFDVWSKTTVGGLGVLRDL
ncbi:mevalonate kinase-like [Biomphalaria glabrata]|uniref:Mevalonate kinase n=1 Tax=Biomphalaria glabrata TaxID=6526 RepID=A0A9W2YFP2_BIOGL|nr:mevalonate kinase-like [Biomphalaria glabrata]KAI8753809.1 mevalonate kinase-like; partial [Biomphalaria glabrata]